MNPPRPGWSFFGGNRLPVVLQSEAAECGLACLAMISGFHGFKCDLICLRRRYSISLKGATLSDLISMARDMRLAPRALRLDMEQLAELKRPAILHWNMDHFVVLERVGKTYIWIVDPAVGRRKLSRQEASRRFTGIALELSPANGFERRRESSPLRLSAMFCSIQGLPAALAKVLGLSIALQVFLLAAPLFSQVVIDDIVVSNDRDLLTVLGTAFLLVVVIRICVSGIRGWLLIALGANLQLGWVSRLFHHLVRLPMEFFERRHMGDIVSRFDSIQAVEALVANKVVEAIVDGMMAVTTVCVMFFYSTLLASVVIAAVLLYTLLRLVIFTPLWTVTHESLVLGARVNSMFMETVRAILPLKNFGREAIREAAWQNQKVEALNADIRVRRLHLVQHLADTGIFAVENVVVLWLGAIAVLDGRLSIGMLVAFISYKSHFAARTAALVDKVMEFRLVRLHLDRLADIALAEPDAVLVKPTAPGRTIKGGLQVRDLWFRYSDRDPFVIQALNLKVRPGECLAIAGPSGIGKTTLVKLMMGLLQPTAGRVVIDNMDLQAETLGNYRQQMAAVMQQDILLSGSLAENISLFDPGVDQSWLEACAQRAAIHEDIVRLPMMYSTLIGEMGSALSGGQKQRILLARALYARPRVLFLDEATSQTDPFTEHRIHQSLKDLKITCIMIAHRQETQAVADRVIQLRNAAGNIPDSRLV